MSETPSPNETPKTDLEAIVESLKNASIGVEFSAEGIKGQVIFLVLKFEVNIGTSEEPKIIELRLPVVYCKDAAAFGKLDPISTRFIVEVNKVAKAGVHPLALVLNIFKGAVPSTRQSTNGITLAKNPRKGVVYFGEMLVFNTTLILSVLLTIAKTVFSRVGYVIKAQQGKVKAEEIPQFLGDQINKFVRDLEAHLADIYRFASEQEDPNIEIDKISGNIEMNRRNPIFNQLILMLQDINKTEKVTAVTAVTAKEILLWLESLKILYNNISSENLGRIANGQDEDRYGNPYPFQFPKIGGEA